MTSLAVEKTDGTATENCDVQLYYLFGLPATGKSHIGRILQKHFGFQYYDADEWLPDDLLDSLKQGNSFTPAQRDRYYSRICDNIDGILNTNDNTKTPVVVAQATFKNKHRLKILKRFPYIRFIWIQTSMGIRLKRLNQRDFKDNNSNVGAGLALGSKAATAEWCEKNDRLFELPDKNTIPHTVFVNNSDATNSDEILYNDLLQMFDQEDEFNSKNTRPINSNNKNNRMNK